MIRIDRRNRTLTVCASALCFASAFVAAPEPARSAYRPASRDAPTRTNATRRQPIVLIEPLRDPFVGDFADPQTASRPAVPVSVISDPAIPSTTERPFIALPANAGAGVLSTGLQTAGLRVRAIVTGERPVALLVDAYRARVVTVGEAVDGTTVSAIEHDGIRLADGRRLKIETGESHEPLTGRRDDPVPLVPRVRATVLQTVRPVPQ